MKIEYDPKYDLLNIEFIAEEQIAESVELDGLVVDYSKDGRIVAIEILDAGKRTTKNPLDLIDFTIVKEKAVDSFQSAASRGLSLRILLGNKLGFSYTSDNSPPSIDRLIKEAFENAANNEVDADISFSKPSKEAYIKKLYDDKLKGIGEKEKIERCMRLERAARQYDKRIKNIRHASYEDSEYRRVLMNSNGVKSIYSDTVCSTSIMLVAEENGNSETGWEFDYNRFYDSLKTDEVGIGSAPVDGEGTAAGKTLLIEKGYLKAFLHNIYTANKWKTASTGNGVRGGFKGLPGVGITNLFIEKGNISMEDLIKGIDKGIHISEAMGVHTANPISGDFSIGIAGHWIENGKFSFPVRGVVMAGNIF